MIIEILKMSGLNQSLFVDIIFAASFLYFFATILAFGQLKGMAWPLVKSRLTKTNLAILDLGGIETPIINYPRGAKELKYEFKGNKSSWTIPEGIERMFPNNSRYILASIKIAAPFNSRAIVDVKTAKEMIDAAKLDENGQPISEGDAYNINQAADILEKVRKMLSPKGQANTIDDRAKQIADKKLAGQNVAIVYGAAIAIVVIVCVFAYLIMIKGAEYQICTTAARTIAEATTTTLKLPPL